MEIKVEKKVLDANDEIAAESRRRFAEKGVFVLNVMSSPGSGKTTTLKRTLEVLAPEMKCAVMVGDIATTHDADRLATPGVETVQINTDRFGGACHLSAKAVADTADAMDLSGVDLLIVENVGNLVCPAEMDIGEDAKIVVLSTTEGEDKPVKYPQMFMECEAAILNKIDLLPYLDFDAELAVRYILQVHPGIPVFSLSAKTGEGFAPWLDWLRGKVAAKKQTG